MNLNSKVDLNESLKQNGHFEQDAKFLVDSGLIDAYECKVKRLP